MSKNTACWLVVYDGKQVELRPGRRTSEGITDRTGASWPMELLYRSREMLSGRPVYFLPIESPVLLEHQVLERSRRAILKGQLFKPGGDIIEMLRMAAAILMIVVAIAVWFQFGGLSGRIERQSILIERQMEILSKPLVVQGE